MAETPINYQSPYDATSLITFLQDPVTTAYAWKLTPAAGSVLTNAIGATSHTKDLTLPGHSITFRTNGGIIPAAIDSEAGQEGAGAEFLSIFDDTVLTKNAINAGDWNGAKLEIFLVDYRVPNKGQLIEFAGRLGTVREEGQGFRAEARQLTTIARLKIGRLVTAHCSRVKVFGDSFCKKDLAALTRTARVVTSVSDAQNTFRASALPTPTVAYANGRVTFTTGLNTGRTFQIKSYDNTTKEIVFHLDTPFAIAVNDQFTIIEGCDRTMTQCVQYGNGINHGGFAYLTNIEEMNRVDRAV